MGLSTALYKRSLLSIDSVELPRCQCICFAFRLSWFLLVWMCLPISVFYQDLCPGISLHFSEADQHGPFVVSDRFGCVGLMYLIIFYSYSLDFKN
jgi:hypothetical protein